MPDYNVNGPAGERFKLSVPDGVSDDELHSTLADIIPQEAGTGLARKEEISQPSMEGRSGAQEAQEARDVAAIRVKQAVAPGDRPEPQVPEHLQSWGHYAAHAGQQLKEAATDIVQHPENLVGTGELGGIVRPIARGAATGGLRPFQTQQLLVQYNRDLAAGRITEEQFRARRESLGLPAETPSYLRPVSATQQPRVTTRERGSIPGIREPNQQTLSELREISALPLAPPPEATTQPPRMRQGFLGGDDSARQLFQDHIAPYIDEETFAHSYFGGMYSQSVKLTKTLAGGLDFNGNLALGGKSIGEIHRRIFPDRGAAVHDFLELNDDAQASGIAKSLLRNQIDTYKAIGIDHVSLTAGLQVGGYSWAKYGFLPDETAWRGLQTDLRNRMRYLRMDNDVRVAVEHLIESENPIAIWRLSDMRQPVHRTISNDQVPAGKGLLLGQTWKGSLDLTDQAQMKRFHTYVR